MRQDKKQAGLVLRTADAQHLFVFEDDVFRRLRLPRVFRVSLFITGCEGHVYLTCLTNISLHIAGRPSARYPITATVGFDCHRTLCLASRLSVTLPAHARIHLPQALSCRLHAASTALLVAL